MEKNNFILVSTNDPRAKDIAKILGNKTCNKILEFIEENPKATESDISSKLNIPLNTIGYNIKQLLKAELITKSENFFWSKKGKKIATYIVSNKSIIFSPKKSDFFSQMKAILPVSLISGLGALFIRFNYHSINVSREASNLESLAYSSKDAIITNAQLASGNIAQSTEIISLGSPAWWFLGGFFLCVIIFILVTSILKLERNYTSEKKNIKQMKGGNKNEI